MLKEIAIRETSISGIIEGRTKIDIDTVINTVLTISTIDLIKMRNKNTGDLEDVAIVIFKEKPDNFIFGGICFVNIIKAWIDACGTVESVNEGLQTEDIQIKIEKTKTKTGNNVNKVIII